MEKQQFIIQTLIENFAVKVIDINLDQTARFDIGPPREKPLTAVQELLANSLRIFGQVRPIYAFEENGIYQVFEGYGMVQAMRAMGQKKASILHFTVKKEDVPAVQFIVNWDKETSYKVKADNFRWLKEYCREYVLKNKGETETRLIMSALLKMSPKTVSMFEAIIESEDAEGLIEAMDARLESLNSAHRIATGTAVRDEAKEPEGKTGRKAGDSSQRIGPYDFCKGCPKLEDALRNCHFRKINDDMPLDDNDGKGGDNE